MFKFNDFPTLKKCHLEYDRLVDHCYELEAYVESLEEVMSTETASYVSVEESKRMDARIAYELVYAKTVYNIFKNIRPILRNTTGGNIMWEELFDKPFEEIDKSDRNVLVGLIEEETIYRLPPQYYD